MSESNLHKHFRDDDHVPIPIPSADDSWKLMEQRLHEVMPVTHQTGGHTAPNSTGIIAKMLPVIKYAVAALFVTGVVLYSVHRINRPAPIPTPETEINPITTKDSTARSTDSMADHVNTGAKPDTTLNVHNINTPVVTAAGTSGIQTRTGAHTENTTAAGTGATIGPIAGTSATNMPTGTNTGNAVSAATNSAITAKTPMVPKTTGAGRATPAAGNTPFYANATGKQANATVAGNNQARHRTASGKGTKPVNQQKGPLTSGQQQPADVNNTRPPADSPEENNIAVVGRTDNPLPETAAMLKPELSGRLILQPLPLHKAGQPLKVSRETMDRLAGYRMPRARSHVPGYWQLMAQWSVPLPVVSSPAYYKGPDGNSRLYSVVIPGVRMQRTWNNAALSLDLNVMATQLYKNEPYYYNNNLSGSDDWMTRTILQTYGYSASLAYHHRIAGNFFGSAGVQGYYGQTASIHEVVQSHDTTGVHTRTSTTGDKSKIWNSISKFQGRITGEIYYDHARWQAAARTVVPVLHTAKDSMGMNMKTAVQLELLFRWKINRRK
ncbi:hypothetical protein [Chitinophaga varians]|uniref:hypothetical protein n=1 Tax=Chitinophaga varians TaxID=2202339 RepID=UPI00165FADCB|nr:hypothetical protein [Chitinophaga varians]MBC9911570.1 hypothetical protein [Chitinophaga varians]